MISFLSFLEGVLAKNERGYNRIGLRLIDATDGSSDQKRIFFAVSLTPFHFSRTLPLKFLEFGFFILRGWSWVSRLKMQSFQSITFNPISTLQIQDWKFSRFS